MKVSPDTVGTLERVMDHARARHEVLSGNVVHADTPGYRARDLAPVAFGQKLEQQLSLQPSLARTDPRHLSGEVKGPTSEVTTVDDVDPREDGNTVRLEQQMARLEENRVRFKAAGTVVSRRLALLRYAASDGNG